MAVGASSFTDSPGMPALSVARLGYPLLRGNRWGCRESIGSLRWCLDTEPVRGPPIGGFVSAT